MLKVEKIEIAEFRGIRQLAVDLKRENFAVCGPNGTGKSGVVDALDFALTGNISRLSGKGTGGLSVKEHGPHVDSRNRPDKARVKLHVYIPSIKKSATIERNVRDAKKPTITPDTPEIRAAFDTMLDHPEFVLSRREIIRYILAEPGKRSEEVQALLRLEQVEILRRSLQKIANACEKEKGPLSRVKDGARDTLLRALGITQLKTDGLLKAVNDKRAVLGLAPIVEYTPTVSVKDGVATAPIGAAAPVPKAQALKDLTALKQNLEHLVTAEFQAERDAALAAIQPLKDNTALAEGVERDDLLKKALEFYDDKECPVCATPFDPEQFRAVVNVKRAALAEAASLREEAEKVLAPLVTCAANIHTSLQQVAAYAKKFAPPVASQEFDGCATLFKGRGEALDAFLPLSTTETTLASFHEISAGLGTAVSALTAAITALPEPSTQDAAREYLTIAQEKLEAYRTAALHLKRADERATLSKIIQDAYTEVSTKELEGIYQEVEKDFSDLYRFINSDDEQKFEARLVPSLARLAFDVDFYGRGFFPPGAYHSEGHQDGMGLCLYLALMKHILGENFQFAVLDDVVMSVDSGHRREVCKLLKERFPNTQFVLTTHDEVWLRHMCTAGLVKPKSYIQFRRWDVDRGPVEWTDKDVWNEIEAHVKSNDIRSAAALLRHYLEYFAREACDELRARVEFHGDGRYELGDLLPSAIGRLKELMKKGKDVAQSWGDKSKSEEIAKSEAAFTAAITAANVEQWQINPAVHYNEWANLVKADFEPVVVAYKSLVATFKCAVCGGLLYLVLDQKKLDALRCSCATTNVNLKPKAA